MAALELALSFVAWVAPPAPEDKPAAYTLEWSSPAACPQQAEVEAAIAALTQAATGGTGTMAVFGEVTATEDRFRLQLRTRYGGRDATRSLEAAACQDLADTTVLVVAVALEPSLMGDPTIADAVASTAPADAAPHTDPAPPRVPPPAQQVASRPRAPEGRFEAPEPDAESHRAPSPARSAPSLGLRLAPLVDLGGTPLLSGGLSIAAGLQWPRLRVELLGVHRWPRRTDGGAARVQLGAVGAQACGRPTVGPIEFPLCAGIETGALRADRRTAPRRHTHGPWLAPRASAGLAVAGQRVGFWGAVDAAVPAISTRILDGQDALHTPPAVSIRVLLGLEIFLFIDRG